MKKKGIIRLLAAVMLLTALLCGCGTARITEVDNESEEAPAQMSVRPMEANTDQQTEKTVTVFPVDLRFTECAVLALPREPEPTEPQAPSEVTMPVQIEPADEKHIGGIDSILGGAQEQTPQEQMADGYMVFRYAEPQPDGEAQRSVYRIQVQKQTEDGVLFTGSLIPGEGVQWDVPEDTLVPEWEQMNQALLGDLQWLPCTETGLYAVNTRLTRCLVSGGNVYYTDDAFTIFQVQRYDVSGVLTSVVSLTQEDGVLLEEGAVSQALWNPYSRPNLRLQTREESPKSAAGEDPDVQKLIADYEARLQDLRQQNERGKMMVIAVGAVAALLAITSLICLLCNFKCRKKVQGSSQTTKETAAQDPGAVRAVRSFGVVHNIGRRTGQQDSFDVIDCPVGTLAVVADGMGGLADGDKVSQKIVATMRADSTRLRPGSTDGVLHQLIAHVNQEVNRMLGTANQYKCGSTLLAVLVEKGTMQWATVGDSRIYLYRGGSLLQVNREHIYKGDLLERAINGKISFAEAMRDPQLDRLSSFIGMGELRHVDSCLSRVKVLRGDRILLMSDGVFNTLSNDEIAEVIRNAPSTADAAKQLEQNVLQKQVPNQDNFTCVILEV